MTNCSAQHTTEEHYTLMVNAALCCAGFVKNQATVQTPKCVHVMQLDLTYCTSQSHVEHLRKPPKGIKIWL